ncbi:MAG: hypothetical protein U0075_08560 [Thermomicrobiales bacterium]
MCTEHSGVDSNRHRDAISSLEQELLTPYPLTTQRPHPRALA